MKWWQKALYPLVRRGFSLLDTDRLLESSPESHAGEMVTQSSVLALSTAWACVNLLAGTIGSLPLMVYRKDKGGVSFEAHDHPLYPLLHDSPNADQTSLDFWEFLTVSLELQGNAYARIVRDSDRNGKLGNANTLLPVSPDLVVVRRLNNGRLEYSWSESGQSNRVDQSEMLHIRGFGGSPLGGLSTLAHGRNTFGLATAIEKAAGTTFKNGMRPSGVLTYDKFLTEEHRKIAETKLVEKFVGAANTGKPLILEGGAKWTPLAINPDDLQMLESRGFSVPEVCRMFGVPPFMIGHTEKVTSFGTGLGQQLQGFVKFTLRRRLKRNEQAMEKQLLTPADRAAGIRIRFNLEGLLRGDIDMRSKFYTAMLAAGVMTINEVRTLENLPPVPGGDIPRLQMQNVPIDQAGNAIEDRNRDDDENV